MNYTNEQYALLASFEKGRNIDDLTESELWGYQLLMEQGLLQPRADIENGWHLLSEKGKVCLHNHNVQLQQLSEAREKYTQEERHRTIQDNAAKAGVIVPVITFILGILLEHFTSIIDGIVFAWEFLFK